MSQTPRHLLLGHVDQLLTEHAAGQCNDQELLDRFSADRSEQPFAALVRRHGPLVLGVCRRVLHHEQDVEDAFQATFFTLARRAGAIRKRQSISSWLYQVAYRVALKVRSATKPSTPPSAEPAAPNTDPLEAMSGRELLMALDEELQRLPEKYRLPLVLCFLEGKTQDEAAREVGWPRGTLKDRLEHGKELLRTRLARRGLTVSAALLPLALTQNLRAATISAVLIGPTVQAARQFASHGLAAGGNAKAVALAEGLLHSMHTSKWKIAAMLFLAVGVLAAGVVVIHRSITDDSQLPPAAIAAAAAPNEDAPPPPAKPLARRDVYGDPLPEHAIARFGTVRFQTFSDWSPVVYAPDGKSIATNGLNHTICLHDAETGKEIGRLVGRESFVSDLAFSRDGRSLVSSSNDGSFAVWEVASGKRLQHVTGKSGGISRMALAPDDKTVASVHKDAVRLWDLATGKEQRLIPLDKKDEEARIAFSPDGKSLAIGQRSVQLWDPATGQLIRRLDVTAAIGKDWISIASLAFSTDGKTIAAAIAREPNHSIVHWDVTTGKMIRELKGLLPVPHNSWREVPIAFSPDGKLLVVGNSNVEESQIVVWDAVTGKELRRLTFQRTFIVHHLAFSPDSKTLALNAGSRLSFWDLETGKERPLPGGDQRYLTAVAVAPDGRRAAVTSTDNTVRVWETQTGKELLKLPAKKWARALAFSPDGAILASVGGDDMLRWWDPISGKALGQLSVAANPAVDLVFSPDGKILAAAGDKGVSLWNLASGKELARFGESYGPACAVAFSPDGVTLASGSRRWDSKNNEARITQVAAALWRVPDGKEICRLDTDDWGIGKLAFTRDGKTLAVLSSVNVRKNVRFWEVATRKVRREIFDTQVAWGSYDTMALSPNGKIVAFGKWWRSPNALEFEVGLLEVRSGKEVAAFGGHCNSISSVAFSRDGTRLVSASGDETALVWDVSRHAAKQPVVRLAPEQLESLWSDLADAEAPKAFDALLALEAAPAQVVAWLGKQLQAAPPVPKLEERLPRLLGDLESDKFAVRKNAEEELARLGELARMALEKALADGPTLDKRQRLEPLLEKLNGPVTDPELRRALRAVEVLEHIGTPEARQLLESLAKGAPHARLTKEAKSSLDRLAKRPASPPTP
jgi:RNA polymerase sigma factor (sigma-70 family)